VCDASLDGCAVLLHLPSARRTVLSDTATAVWLEVVAEPEGADVDEVAVRLAERYGEAAARVTSDVEALVTELLAAGLVEPVEGPPS
jgi:hypothetical protein